jgi:uncharacterized protein (DUF983 family)
MPDRSRCPNCGERVSPYAAGCAVCGADLDTKRWDDGPGAGQQVSSWLSSLTHGGIPTWALWGLVVLAALVAYGVIS